MRDPRLQLKNPFVAAILAYLIPGAGHWYQGRRFKATIYSACILSLFIWGMVLGSFQPVYSALVPRNQSQSTQFDKTPAPPKLSFGYLAQVLVGAAALPAVIQEVRFGAEEVDTEKLYADINSDFTGIVRLHNAGSETAMVVRGRIELSPENPAGSRDVTGTLTGKTDDGTVVEFTLGGPIRIGREVFGSPRREIECGIVGNQADSLPSEGKLTGTVERSFQDWFQAPCDSHELDRLHGSLSRQFDVASVFTWIAGLLNLLAIWDAADGPAYGYGDEKPEPSDDDESPKKS